MKYSVIIPVYNAEESMLNDAVFSIHSNAEYEIIIIDDGSMQSTANFCDQIALIDNHIKVIHQKNAGVASARNTGIKNAFGDYILFLDADDMFMDNTLERLDCELDENTDLTCFSVQILSRAGVEKKIFSGNTEVDVSLAQLAVLTYNKDFSNCFFNTVWGKVYRRDIIQESGIRFIVGMKRMEDGLFNLMYLQETKRIIYADVDGYIYRINTLSTVNSYNPNYSEDLVYSYQQIRLWMVEKNCSHQLFAAFYQKIWKMSIDYLKKSLFVYQNNLSESEKKKEFYRYMSSVDVSYAIKYLRLTEVKDHSMKKYYPFFKLKKYWFWKLIMQRKVNE
ncbi:MAG: glycosyltransferase [Lachnospiraceae bacterium]|nr:glycosyltransferase [Lachnospiraceae bacterium]